MNMENNTMQAAILRKLFKGEDGLTFVPIVNAMQYRMWAIRKNTVPTIKADISFIMSSTSPTKETMRPARISLGTR